MSLKEIALPTSLAFDASLIPSDVEQLIVEAERRIVEFQERTSDDPRPSFVPSDFRATYRALAWIQSGRLPAGPSFCEWGSGFGVVAMLASMGGLHSTGIEVDALLVGEARSLAGDFAIEVDFVSGSFVPEGSVEQQGAQEELAWLDYSAVPVYRSLGYDIDDFDLIFAYPWPGEWQVIFDLFDEHASSGALLLTYHGIEGLRLHRRRGRRNERQGPSPGHRHTRS